MSDEEASPLRDQAAMILKMTGEAKRVQRRCGAEACIVICVFKDGTQLRLQDAGKFILPPDDFYGVMQQAHINGQMGSNGPKVKPSKVIRPHH